MYLPVGSGHSTLIKVSSIRSAGWGNRSITRTSALSTLPGADRPSPKPKNPLRLYVPSIYQTSCPLNLPSRPREISSKVDRPRLAPPRTLSLLTASPRSAARQRIPRGMARVQVVIHRLAEQTRSCRCVPRNCRMKKVDGGCWGF